MGPSTGKNTTAIIQSIFLSLSIV
ncbi:MAG: hypothetical protein RI909_1709, partial [Bacteroidota bacterium]